MKSNPSNEAEMMLGTGVNVTADPKALMFLLYALFLGHLRDSLPGEKLQGVPNIVP